MDAVRERPETGQLAEAMPSMPAADLTGRPAYALKSATAPGRPTTVHYRLPKRRGHDKCIKVSTDVLGMQKAVQGPSAEAVAELFEHIVRSVHAASFTHGLNPAQWNALRYLRSAPASARSLKTFARHQLVTDSTASQTIAALVRKGLVSKSRDRDDGRGVLLELTASGAELLRSDPMLSLVAAFASLDTQTLMEAAEVGAMVAKHLFLNQNNPNE